MGRVGRTVRCCHGPPACLLLPTTGIGCSCLQCSPHRHPHSTHITTLTTSLLLPCRYSQIKLSEARASASAKLLPHAVSVTGER